MFLESLSLLRGSSSFDFLIYFQDLNQPQKKRERENERETLWFFRLARRRPLVLEYASKILLQRRGGREGGRETTTTTNKIHAQGGG